MIKKYLSLYRVMSGSGVRAGQPTPEEKRAAVLARLKVEEIERRPNSKKIAEELGKAKALEDYAKWSRDTNHGRFLPRAPLPHADISQSEAQLRALGLTGRLTDTVLRGNSEAFAEGIYRARGPEAMKVRGQAIEAMKKNPQFTQMPQAVKEEFEARAKLVQEEIQERDKRAMHSVLAPLRITGENIYWGQHVPSKPKEIIWGGKIFDALPRDQQKNIYRLSNSINSGNPTVVNVNEYKIALDNLIRLDLQSLNTLETLVTSKLQLDNIKIIKDYWNRYNRFDYSIEPDEIYFFIFDWISKNTVFTEEPYVIFSSGISELIRSILEESRIQTPEPDPYPEFNERKREFIRRLYYSAHRNSQSILNEFMNDEEQNRFKPRLMRELNLRETQANKIYEFAENFAAFHPRIVIEDCKLLWYQLTRITQRMRKLYPMYRDEEVYPANQSTNIIDSILQQELSRRFIRNEEPIQPVEFDSLTLQMKKLATNYRTIEFECFKEIQKLHKPEKENIKGGSKTRKNKRKQ